MDSGDAGAATGMSKAIYDQLNASLSPQMMDMSENDLAKVRDQWRKLAYAVARGVIDHLTAHMEVYGIETSGKVDTTVTGNTARATPNNHLHAVDLPVVQQNVLFTQSNDGTGHVR